MLRSRLSLLLVAGRSKASLPLLLVLLLAACGGPRQLPELPPASPLDGPEVYDEGEDYEDPVDDPYAEPARAPVRRHAGAQPPRRRAPAPPPHVPAEPPAPVQSLGPAEIELAVVDVGQGDGIVVRTGDGHAMVVDTGTKGGGKKLVKFLQRIGLKTADYLVLTHPHADHIAGTGLVLKQTEFKEVWVSGMPSSSKTYARVIEAINKSGAEMKKARRGSRVPLGRHAEIIVLGPQDPLVKGSRSDVNANSVILWVRHGEVDFLLMGDAEHETEERVIAVLHKRGQPDFEVLKVAHHGSRHASSKEFLTVVRPDVAVISVAARNRYKHPSPETITRLQSAGAAVYRTDRNGTVRIRSDGKTFKMLPSRGGPQVPPSAHLIRPAPERRPWLSWAPWAPATPAAVAAF